MKDSLSDLLTEIILLTFRLNGRLIAEGDRLTKPFDQTSSRWQVLGLLVEPTTVSHIANMMGLARQSVQRTADLLVEEGLCEFIDNPHHQRSKKLSLTKKGKAILDSITEVQIKWAKNLAQMFSRQELETTLKVMETFIGRLGER